MRVGILYITHFIDEEARDEEVKYTLRETGVRRSAVGLEMGSFPHLCQVLLRYPLRESFPGHPIFPQLYWYITMWVKDVYSDDLMHIYIVKWLAQQG